MIIAYPLDFARTRLATQGEKKVFNGIWDCIATTAARSAVLPFNYPFDTVRRRLMLESEVPAAERTYKSGAHCAKEIMKNEGLAGMYKGVVPEIFRGLGGSIVIVAYDRIKNALDL